MTAYFEFKHTVSPDDIDELGHAGNFHYIKWMQFAAIAHSTENGWPPNRYDEIGAGWVVRSHNISYLKQAFEGDEVLIRTWVANMKPATSLRCYEILNASGELLARAETNWAFVNFAKQRPTRIPEQVASCFTVVGD